MYFFCDKNTRHIETNDKGFVELYREEFFHIIANKQIETVYQPIVSLKSGDIFGYEGLTRGPKEGFFQSPIHLFEYAETNGQLFQLEKVTRELAIERSTMWMDGNKKLFININSQVMQDPQFTPGYTSQVLKRFNLSPSNIVFEITERSAIKDFMSFKQILHHYRNQGFQIAVDDAGAGYSSLQAISELQPDYIKIDRSLIQNIHREPVKEALVEAFVITANKMNSKVVAEGIETAAELKKLIQLDIDYCQGFFLAKPSYPVTGISAEAIDCLKEKKAAFQLNKAFSCDTSIGDMINYFKATGTMNEHMIVHDNLVIGKVERREENDEILIKVF
ncbi:MAG: EAL domain-containing protein [Bacillaceae bacterium]|nr:EAL domain-containing protein [Bacillaceae bacterium]